MMRRRRNPEDDYRMRHRPSEGERAHELGAEWLPADVLTHPGQYTGFRELLPEFWPVLRSAQGKPRKMIDIYRALPKPHATFRTGDWVTLSPSYAVMHLQSNVSGGGHVIKASVPAETLRFAGDDLMEWGYWGPTIEGEPRSWLRNPHRNPRNPQTETAAFKKWFGDSKVVDAQGKPLVVYHGTSATFDTFDVGLSWDGGFHFGTAEAATNRIADGAGLDPERWSTYFSVSPSIMPVYLSIKDPRRLNYDPIDEETWAFVIGEAKDNGYDGVVYPNSVEGGESWVAFDARQIKSATGNAGTFDPDDASILRNPRTRRTRSRRNPDPTATPASSATKGAAFRRWFGKSKVVDAEGNPRVVYHGTAYAPGQPSITEFRGPHQPFRYPAFSGGRGKFVGVGSFFSESEEVAASYPYVSLPQTQNYTRVVHTLYLRIERPKVYRTLRAAMEDMVARVGPDPVAFVALLRTEGYDGITFMEGPSYAPTSAKKKARVWITFDPRQVKSATDNAGTFDPDDPSTLRNPRTRSRR